MDTTLSSKMISAFGKSGTTGILRVSRFGKIEDYNACAEQELWFVVQVETAEALEKLEEIDTIDSVFIGPPILSASMRHPGKNRPSRFGQVHRGGVRAV